MNINRITISLPQYTYDLLTSIVPRGRISSYISEIIQVRLVQEKIIKKKKDPWEDFLNIRKKYDLPDLTDEEIKSVQRKGLA